jgi:hypothetical protein
MKLYEIKGQAQRLDEFIGDISTPEDAKAFSELYAEIEEAFDVKAHSVCCVIKNTTSEAEALAEEIKRLQARKKACETKADNLKKYIEYEMRAMGKDAIKTPLFSLAIQKNPDSCKVDESGLEDKWFKIERKPDTTKIKEALKAGEKIECAWLESSESLRIR